MTDPHDTYVSPLAERNATPEMLGLFSPNFKFRTWRKLWIALAEAQHELKLDITRAQIDELRRFQDVINYDVAEKREAEVRHDVMAHVHAFGVQCPAARPIIHLGATSCYVTDNTDLIIMKEAMRLLCNRLAGVIDRLADFAMRYKDLPCLGFTHFQPAQPITVGKRACLWLQDFVLDLEELEHRIERLPFRGVKGTVGTQASFLELFNGDAKKVEKLDRLVCEKMGFPSRLEITGQTYTRKIDWQVLQGLSGIAQSASKMANDIRLLANLKEIEEPFEKQQIGSSAMAYKRNPMRCERICGLSRFIISNVQNAAHTAAVQWLERTLDDSSNRRLSISESFLAADGVLNLCLSVSRGMVVYPQVIAAHLDRELPFMATEAILMAAVQAGGDRQDLHERIRNHSQEAARRIKEEGKDNDLLERLAADPAFARVRSQLPALTDARRFIGLAPQQVERFVGEKVDPIRTRYQDSLGQKAQLKV
ncbi:MAG TPA: adenylosuccinate lyase [Planctomycetota bacterium]|nr:adenylosuccinate lyase [Planctomycetota bacterium]